jgi:hypothetical protein
MLIREQERPLYMTVGAKRNEVNFGTEWSKRTFALQAHRKGHFMTVDAERNEVNFGTEWNKRTFALQALRKGLVESGGRGP